MAHGMAHKVGIVMGGPWCAPPKLLLYGWPMACPLELVLLWVIYGVLHIESNSMDSLFSFISDGTTSN